MTDRNVNGDHDGHPPYATSHDPTFPLNQTNGHHGPEHNRLVLPRSAYPHNQHPPLGKNRDDPLRGYYSQGSHQSGHVYQPCGPHHAVQAQLPTAAGVPFYQQVGGIYQSHGGGYYQRRYRDYQLFGNKFSALDFVRTRRPPPVKWRYMGGSDLETME